MCVYSVPIGLPIFHTVNTFHNNRVHHYKQKKGKTYTEDDVSAAVATVSEGKSVHQAASPFKVPKSTIADHVAGKHLAVVGHKLSVITLYTDAGFVINTTSNIRLLFI